MTTEQVCLEIIERQRLASLDIAAYATRKIRRKGFRFAIDNAGIGHNGLTAPQKMDVSTIKNEKYFIDHIVESPRSLVMVDMLISVARRYKMTTIAEGVETHNQRVNFKSIGVHAFQSYPSFKSQPAEKFSNALVSELDCAETRKNSACTLVQEIDEAARVPDLGKLECEDPDLDEFARFDVLRFLQILDTNEEQIFDRIPQLISQALDMPIAAIALIDKNRRWFKSIASGQREQISQQQSFRDVRIQKCDPTMITDTVEDDVLGKTSLSGMHTTFAPI